MPQAFYTESDVRRAFTAEHAESAEWDIFKKTSARSAVSSMLTLPPPVSSPLRLR